MFTTAQLMSLFDADYPNGVLRWKGVSKYHRERVGEIAGTPNTNSSGKTYWTIRIAGKSYKRSRLMFAIANGRWPLQQVDHINGDSTDDRPNNLREASATQNSWNHKKRAKKNNLPMGVKPMPNGRFNARITCNGEKYSLGVYDTAELAASVYQAKRKELFGEFA